MKFINKGEPIKIRIGKFPYECYWATIKTNGIVELPSEQGKILGLTALKTTEGQLGSKKVETKQIDTDKSTDHSEKQNEEKSYSKKLNDINGIGKKTAEDIIKVFPTEEGLLKAISHDDELPFRDDVEEKLKRRYGK